MGCSVQDVHGGIVGVPQDQHELDARVPIIGHFVLIVALLEVEGRKIDVVAKGKEEYPPGMSATLKNRTMLSPRQVPPIFDVPCVYGLSLCFLVGQLGHVPLQEGLVVVGAGLGLRLDFIHGIVSVGGDDGHVGLLVVLAVHKHVAAELQARRKVSNEGSKAAREACAEAYLIHSFGGGGSTKKGKRAGKRKSRAQPCGLAGDKKKGSRAPVAAYARKCRGESWVRMYGSRCCLVRMGVLAKGGGSWTMTNKGGQTRENETRAHEAAELEGCPVAGSSIYAGAGAGQFSRGGGIQ